MGKYQKISYKIFHNERLKQTDFHGRKMHPLYVRLIHARQPTDFKCFHFDFFAQEKFAGEVAGHNMVPSMESIETMEKSLLDFIIERHRTEFSVESFHGWYQYYARDLLTLLEDGFYKYLYTFFHDEGAPVFASLCESAKGRKHAGLLMRDLKVVLKPSLYVKLVGNAVHYAPPYLPFHAFAGKVTGDLAPMLSVKDWHMTSVQETFREYLAAYYPAYKTDEVFEHVNAIVGAI
ncbi:hypothetical protein [Parapedobacter sp. 2B3]|uniref:hypothetical protein n=1 Tax=Parapedobacter sp. 2B3 TaxID=3342381 RepID=UPI0035B573B7